MLTALNGYYREKLLLSDVKDGLFEDILKYFESSYGSKYVIRDSLKRFVISRSTLWRLFKAHTDITPVQYVEKIRLENARLLLCNNVGILNISLICGFSDCSYFIRRFKIKYGLTPLQFKKETERRETKENNMQDVLKKSSI